MKKIRLPAFLLTCLVSSAVVTQSACVTVNVNFPESAVQKATDDYVRDLYRAKEKGKVTPGQETPPSSKVSQAFSLISEAYADDFKVQSTKAEAIKAKLANRLDDFNAHKRSGAVGESSEGMLVVKSSTLTPLLQKKVRLLVEEENTDRMELYQEVAKLNGLGAGGLTTIQKSFARSFQSLSPSGTWVQDRDGNWARKP